jgi:phytoene synthase
VTELALVRAPDVREVARATIAHHSKSFALASRVLGARLRDPVAIVYTWCRRADDAVDLAATPDDAAAAVARLRVELDLAYAGRAADPVLARFAALGIPRGYADALVDGLAMDAGGARYQTVDDLIAYAYRVAGVVGLMLCHVFGVRDERALVRAAHLGIAMQLTNVCRDVAEDWGRGRLYVPAALLPGAPDLLAHAGRGPIPDHARAPLADAVRALLALADRYYASGDRGVPALPWRAGLAVRAARRVYAAIGRRLARQHHDVTAPRAIVPRAAKYLLVARAIGRGLVAAPRALFARRARVPTRTLELADVPRL